MFFFTVRLVNSGDYMMGQKILICLDIVAINVFIALVIFRGTQLERRQEMITSILSDYLLRAFFFTILTITALNRVA